MNVGAKALFVALVVSEIAASHATVTITPKARVKPNRTASPTTIYTIPTICINACTVIGLF